MKLIPEAQRSVRIRRLARGSQKAEEHGESLAMPKRLEQIAKDLGGAYTNKQQVERQSTG